MPKVKRETTSYESTTTDGRFQRVTFIKETRLDSSGTFSIKMPTEVAVATGVDEATAKTMDGVEGRYREIMEDYKSTKVTKTKVILYHFDYYSRDREPSHTSHMGSGIMFEVSAGVYTELAGLAKSGVTTYDYELILSLLKYQHGVSDHGFRRIHELPERRLVWTRELEDFFVYLQNSMEKLISLAHEMQDPQKLIECANSGVRLLGESKE